MATALAPEALDCTPKAMEFEPDAAALAEKAVELAAEAEESVPKAIALDPDALASTPRATELSPVAEENAEIAVALAPIGIGLYASGEAVGTGGNSLDGNGRGF